MSISQLSRLAAGRELAEESSLIRSERRRGRKLMGKTQIVHLTVTSVDLAHKPKQKPPRIPQVEISICYDVSGVDMVNKDGRSVVLASRKDRAVANYGVANFDWPDPRGWKVTWSDVRGKPCPA